MVEACILYGWLIQQKREWEALPGGNWSWAWKKEWVFLLTGLVIRTYKARNRGWKGAKVWNNKGTLRNFKWFGKAREQGLIKTVVSRYDWRGVKMAAGLCALQRRLASVLQVTLSLWRLGLCHDQICSLWRWLQHTVEGSLEAESRGPPVMLGYTLVT